MNYIANMQKKSRLFALLAKNISKKQYIMLYLKNILHL